MTNPVDPNFVAVDYTDRDYYSLRVALIKRMEERLKAGGWSATDPNDFGVALIESFAYMGDVMSYYIDRVANESFLATATQRENVVTIAKTYGYRPSGYRSAACSVTFTGTPGITIPAGTQLRGSYTSGELVIPVIFETSSVAVIPSGGSVSVGATHGESISLRYPAESATDVAGELIGMASTTNAQNQVFRLNENKVVEGSIKIFVARGSEWEQWTEVDRIVNYGPSDAVYTTFTDSNNYVYVRFGDGISGRVPTPGSSIKAQYVVGGGSEGQIPADVLKTIYAIPGLTPSEASAISSAVSISNTVATGGLEPESIENIRRLAPYALSTMNRAVTLDDYASLMFGGSYISKANAVAESFTSVTVYLAPYAANVKDVFPLYTYDTTAYIDAWLADTPEIVRSSDWENVIVPEAQRLIQNKTQIGVSVTFAPVVYVPVKVDINFTTTEDYTAEQVTEEFKKILASEYSYDKLDFGATLFPEDLETVLKTAPGAFDVTVKLAEYVDPTDTEADSTAVREALHADANEIFILNPTYSVSVNNPTVDPKAADTDLVELQIFEVNNLGEPETWDVSNTTAAITPEPSTITDGVRTLSSHFKYSSRPSFDKFRIHAKAGNTASTIQMKRRKRLYDFVSRKYGVPTKWDTWTITVIAPNRRKRKNYTLRVKKSS